MMNFTYRELDADFDLVLRYGWAVLELRRAVKKLANSVSGNEVVSDKHAAELNQIAGFVTSEYKRIQGLNKPVQETPTEPIREQATA